MQRLFDSHDILRLRSGDEAAFRLVYDYFSEQVYRLAFRFLKNEEQSEDIVQEAFLSLWQSREKLDEHGNMWLYLYVITKRLCLNSIRDIHKSAELFEKLLVNIQQAHNHTEEAILVSDLERYTEVLVGGLPPQQQIVFDLSRTQGLSHHEIAQRLNISPSTVNNHLVQALKTLRTKLQYSDLTFLISIIFY
ncbi:RNA polymerase sigma factor [Pedobacter nyackensis]|uniref:RNA polymerase sigma-70 factor, ECF subfamily n=1 Tax=Pedobacter nyackensis TaxID=475255 RepID=A0A1W2EWR3_9SPHI|nr:RNA polymerase sigma-70 factor [Pedobacter nyackensis]SMD14002.1 RNA polymerase sigma-70 factor, ECF subfamily [Pedobacter nyackensis]